MVMKRRNTSFFNGIGSIILVIPARGQYSLKKTRSGFRADRQRLCGDINQVISNLQKTANHTSVVNYVKI